MLIKNPGLAFNKTVFKNLNPTDKTAFQNATKSLHEALYALKLDEKLLCVKELFKDDLRTFKNPGLTILWPGLLMGLGYGHGTKTGATDKDHPFATEVKTGFFFDFTTGLPVLPGSSVKGILRSFFPGRYKGNDDLKDAVYDRIISILKKIKPESDAFKWNKQNVDDIENTIFKGELAIENGKKVKRFLSSTEQDIFFDAYPCTGTTAKIFETNDPKEEHDIFLGEDIITPHRHPLKDPVPLKLLKVLPGVKIKFQFLLNDYGLSAEDKEKLFIHLLTLAGVGAKKSVGFGYLSSDIKTVPTLLKKGYIDFDDINLDGWDDKIEYAENERAKTESAKKITTPEKVLKSLITEEDSWPDAKTINIGKKIKAHLIKYESGTAFFQPMIKGMPIEKAVKKKAMPRPLTNMFEITVKNKLGSEKKGNIDFEY